MCGAFTPDCEYDKSTFFLNGDVYCPNTNSSGKFCLHKEIFQSLGGSDNQCSECASVCQVRNIAFEGQTKIFSCRLSKVYTFLKKDQNQFKMLLQMPTVLACIVPTEKKRIFWQLCNNSETHLCLWKVWSFVVCSQTSFYVTGARKDDKNRQNTFFIC